MQDLEARLKKEDPDRWLSSRFVADPRARADLALLYLIDNELKAIPAKARDPLLAEMRLTWWRDAIEAAAGGEVRAGHPLLEALPASQLPLGPLAALPERRLAAMNAPADDEALLAQIDETDGFLMGLAALRLHPDARVEQVADAARAYALARRGQADPAAVGEVLRRGRPALAKLPAEAFPAAAHAALASAYAGGQDPGPVGKRLRVTWAVARGRL